MHQLEVGRSGGCDNLYCSIYEATKIHCGYLSDQLCGLVQKTKFSEKSCTAVF